MLYTITVPLHKPRGFFPNAFIRIVMQCADIIVCLNGKFAHLLVFGIIDSSENHITKTSDCLARVFPVKVSVLAVTEKVVEFNKCHFGVTIYL